MPTRPPQHRPLFQPAQPAHLHDRDRGSAAARGYDRTWRKLRLVILARDPLCLFCLGEGRLVPSRQVDHIQTIKDRPDLRLDPANLRGLCDSCHSRRTAQSSASSKRSQPWQHRLKTGD